MLYDDVAGKRNSLTFDSAGDATVIKLVSESQARLTAEQNRPDKAEVQSEIASLEQRVTLLKQSIGE